MMLCFNALYTFFPSSVVGLEMDTLSLFKTGRNSTRSHRFYTRWLSLRCTELRWLTLKRTMLWLRNKLRVSFYLETARRVSKHSPVRTWSNERVLTILVHVARHLLTESHALRFGTRFMRNKYVLLCV